jgi:hypothetical protein
VSEGQRRCARDQPRGAARETALKTTATVPSEAPRAVLHELSLSLARNRDIRNFSRALVERAPARDRLARLALLFTFVSHIVDAPPPDDGVRDGVDWLLALAGEEEGPSVILTALLLALGERAALEYRPGLAFVRVELQPADVARLPPHASLFSRRGRYFIPLDARRARAPFAFLPQPSEQALALRQG